MGRGPRRHRLFTWAALATVVLACDGRLATITIEESATTTVPAASPLEGLIQDFGFGDFVQLDLTSAAELQNQGVQPGDILDVRVTFFDLEADSPSDADLSFLDRLEVYVEAPELDPVLVASASSFPEGERTVSLMVEDVDLTDYVVSESMTITTEASGSRPPQETVVEARAAFNVGVTVQGACNAIKGQ